METAMRHHQNHQLGNEINPQNKDFNCKRSIDSLCNSISYTKKRTL